MKALGWAFVLTDLRQPLDSSRRSMAAEMPDTAPIDWHAMAVLFPVFVEWIVRRFGPLPDGNVRREDYERFKAAFEAEHGLVD